MNQDQVLGFLVKQSGDVLEQLRKLQYAQQRMLERWADGDDNVKNNLWRNLHQEGEKAKELLLKIDSKL